MISIFSPEGKYIPVTIVKVGPCVITQIKTVSSDGYNALQMGFGERKKSRINKPVQGHLKKSGGAGFALLREISVDNPGEYDPGQTVNLEIFRVGERVNITGITKGRGFAGVIKRHGFHGGKKTHGSHSHRIPGSIGCSAWPAKVIKGKKMPGHYGNEQKTVKNLEIVDIRPEEDLIMLKGAVPGFRSGLIEVKKQKNS